MSSADEQHAPSISLGLERIGLVSLRQPVLMLLAAVLLSAGAWLGIARLKVDDSLSALFRTNTPEFQAYERMSNLFPSSEYDVLVVAEADDLLARPKIEKLRELVIELQLIEGTAGLVSLFSARTQPEKGQIPPPLFPDDLPTGAAYDELIKSVQSNEIIKGKLLSDDGKLALIVLALDRQVAESQGLKPTIGEIQAVIADKLKGSGVTAQLSGVPVMQLEIRNAVERDQLVYNGLGLLIGAVIAIVFFGRVSMMLLTVLPPVFAILWSLGALGWLDFRLNLFLNVMTPLIMVMAFSDSMQITFAIRDKLMTGADRKDAIAHGIRVVGPACVLTDATAGLSFIALMFSDSELIRTFGAAGAICTLVAFLAVILFLPLLGLVFVRNEAALRESAARQDWAMGLLAGASQWIADRVLARPVLYALLGAVVFAACAYAHMSLEPRYRLADQVPDKEQAIAASGRLDAKLTGANPVHVMIDLPAGASLYDPKTLAVIGDVQRQVEAQKGVGNVWSLETLKRWLEEKAGERDPAVLKDYVAILPGYLVRRFITEDEKVVVVTGRIPDIDAAEILPVVETIDRALDKIRQDNPGYAISVTGLPAVAARSSSSMIEQLNASLTIEIVFVAGFLALAFRSLFTGVSSLLPGVFPIVASGAFLYATNQGLQFASIVALTVAFGLGLDATIHFLNRMRQEDDPAAPPEEGVRRATILIGPALMLTTIVLACGLAVTVFSELPSLRLFGWLAAITLIAALIGDLVFLPAIVLLMRRLARWLRPSGTPVRKSRSGSA